MTPAMSKKIIIIAGPNGAGKTTFAKNFLPQEALTFRFINADLIAAGLAPFNPESVSFKAARLMLNELDEYTKAGESFAFETTLSGAHYLQRIQEWKDLGYSVKLWFIALSSPELAISRVKERVAQGGHNNNKALKELDNIDPKNCENFMYSIHYVVPRSPTSKKDVLFHEQLLKKKIGGELNRN